MQGADVRSITVLREWQAALTTYHEEVAETLSGIRTEIRRAEDWVAEQLSLWQQAVRDCEEEVHEKKQELNAKKTPGPTGRVPDTTLEERELRRARARLEHAQEKVQTCKSWIGRLPKQIDELYTGSSHRLQGFLDGELARGQALLARQTAALEQYADTRAELGGSTSAAPPAPPK
jgi:DNA repair exonuclease SbcCD ATPase subunit